jgi:hypothetical protein
LTQLGLSPSNIATSQNQELHDQLDRIEQHIASLEVAYQQGQEQAAQEDMHNMAQGASRTHPSLLSGKGGDRIGADDRQSTGDVSTVTVAVTSHTEALPAHGAQEAAGLPSLGQSAHQVCTPHFYQRLPHPLSHLLKELPVVDGTYVSHLCDFLLKVFKIRQVGQMTEPTIYEIMYPYCRGELLALVTNAITARESFDFSMPVC